MIKILALGDSLTAGYGVGPENSFAACLQQRLLNEGWNIQVINGGISGDTTYDGLARIKGLLRHKPALVIIQFGANDLYAGLAADQVENNLEIMIDMCLDKDAEVILAGILCLVDQRDAHSKAVQRAFEQAALSRKVRFLPEFMPDIPGNSDLTLADGIHPNRAGVDRMVENILPMVLSMLSYL